MSRARTIVTARKCRHRGSGTTSPGKSPPDPRVISARRRDPSRRGQACRHRVRGDSRASGAGLALCRLLGTGPVCAALRPDVAEGSLSLDATTREGQSRGWPSPLRGHRVSEIVISHPASSAPAFSGNGAHSPRVRGGTCVASPRSPSCRAGSAVTTHSAWRPHAQPRSV